MTQIQVQYQQALELSREDRNEEDTLVFIAIRKRCLRHTPTIYDKYDYTYAHAKEIQQREAAMRNVTDKLPKSLVYGAEFIAEVGSENCRIHKSRYGPPYSKIRPEDFLFHMVDLFNLIPYINLFDVNEKGKDL